VLKSVKCFLVTVLEDCNFEKLRTWEVEVGYERLNWLWIGSCGGFERPIYVRSVPW